MQRSLLAVCFALTCCFVCAPSLDAQSTEARVDAARQMLSEGIHTLFGGNSSDAERLLRSATALDPRDPRGYYFHSVALRRSGRAGDADKVLAKGAMVEARHGGNGFTISQSLERVQGTDRVKIERARRQARADYIAARQQSIAARYAAREARQALVQRSPSRLPLDAFSDELSVDKARTIAADHTDPFVDDQPMDGAPAAVDGGTEMVADNGSTTDPEASGDSGGFAADSSNPFDSPAPASPFDTPAAGGGAAASTTASAEVPEAARGALKSSTLFKTFGGIFGRGANMVSSTVDNASNVVPGVGLGGGGGGFDDGGFDDGDFGDDGGFGNEGFGPPGGGPPGGGFGPPGGGFGGNEDGPMMEEGGESPFGAADGATPFEAGGFEFGTEEDGPGPAPMQDGGGVDNDNPFGGPGPAGGMMEDAGENPFE